MPSSPYDIKGLLKSSVRNDNPVMFIEHKSLYFSKGEVPNEEYLIPLGKANVKREGENVTIVATSWIVGFAMDAAEQLAEEGISCEVIDPRTIWPLDKETIIKSVNKTKRCIVVTEAPAEGGWSSEVASIVSEQCFDILEKPVKRNTGMRTGIPYGPVLELEVIPSVKTIVRDVRELVK
jgi:pyruvate/2-oxoglutarate/acetoin dehydrogenase E1 component